jgi:hypothetical protein
MTRVCKWDNGEVIKEFPNDEKALEWIKKNCTYEWCEDGMYYFYNGEKIEMY